MLTTWHLLGCGAAAVAGGVMDAISGGGGLISVTTLLLFGVSPHVAIGTNKMGSLFGLAVSFFKFYRSSLINWKLALHGVIFMVAGSLLGAVAALRLDPELLGRAVLVLLPFAAAGIFIPPSNGKKRPTDQRGILLPVFAFSIGCYDGFFGPGSGSFLILGFYWLFEISLIEASATAKPFNFTATSCSALYFLWNGAVEWTLLAVMGAGFIAGNWLGAAYAIRKGTRAVRIFLLLALAFLSISLFWRYFVGPA